MVKLYTSDQCTICKQVLSAMGGEAGAAQLGVQVMNMSIDAAANQEGRALGMRSMPGLAENGQLTASGGGVAVRLRQLGLLR